MIEVYKGWTEKKNQQWALSPKTGLKETLNNNKKPKSSETSMQSEERKRTAWKSEGNSRISCSVFWLQTQGDQPCLCPEHGKLQLLKLSVQGGPSSLEFSSLMDMIRATRKVMGTGSSILEPFSFMVISYSKIFYQTIGNICTKGKKKTATIISLPSTTSVTLGVWTQIICHPFKDSSFTHLLLYFKIYFIIKTPQIID